MALYYIREGERIKYIFCFYSGNRINGGAFLVTAAVRKIAEVVRMNGKAVAALLACALSCGYPDEYRFSGVEVAEECTGVEVYLPVSSLAAGETAQARLLVILGSGEKRPCEGSPVDWRSLDPRVAEVDGSGLVMALKGGETVITAAFGTFSAERRLMVLRRMDCTGVVISEVYYDAPGSDTGREFVELRNTGDCDCDLSGFRLVDGALSSSPFVFPGGSVIPPSGVWAVGQSADGFFRLFGFYPAFSPFSFTLNNSGEAVFLEFADGTPRDEVYVRGGSADFPAPPAWGSLELPAAPEGQSVRRDAPLDTDTFQDWSAGIPDPGT
jgi:hypothetical protein